MPRSVIFKGLTDEELQAAFKGQKPIYMLNPYYDNVIYTLRLPAVNNEIILSWDNSTFIFRIEAYYAWHKIGWSFYNNYFSAWAIHRLSMLDKQKEL